jgi:uncharacterized protein (TIGR02588 family)
MRTSVPTVDISTQPSQGGESQAGSGAQSASRSVAEWVTLIVSSLLVLGLVGLTSWLFLTASTDPAAMTVEPHLDEVYQSGSRFYVPLTVSNTGGRTAEEVRVETTLTDASGAAQSAEFQIQFLAGGGSARGVVSFSGDPRAGQMSAAVVSFLEP